MLLVAAVAMWSCGDDYDDTALRKDVSDLQSRVEKLEAWSTTVNGQISALQGLVTALEENDYVTGVSPITVDGKTGYTITFTKSDAITIFDGINGKDGANGTTPVIGVDKFTDGAYYWTVKTGDAKATWMLDAAGNKVATTGATGKTPVLSVAQDNGKLYWQVDGKWLMNGTEKVPATGDKGETGETGSQGDAVFKKDGVKVNADNTVTFTLAGDNGATFTLPMVDAIKIFSDFATITTAEAKDITLALNIKDADYAAIKAEVTNSKGLSVAVATRAARVPWTVAIKQVPTFNADGSIKDQAIVTVTPPTMDDAIKDTDTALLKVTIVGKDGKEHTATRVLYYSNQIEWAEGNLIANADNSGCEIGAPTDAGLYFQFGSLVGWSTEDPLTIAVKPDGCNVTAWNWSWTGDPATENTVTGTGDPCKYYLKGTWRLPTKDEYVSLFKNSGYPSNGPWKWENYSATNSTSGLTFPASGCRYGGDGSLYAVGANGYYWSASPLNASSGYSLIFDSSYVNPSDNYDRAIGLSVRCVRAIN